MFPLSFVSNIFRSRQTSKKLENSFGNKSISDEYPENTTMVTMLDIDFEGQDCNDSAIKTPPSCLPPVPHMSRASNRKARNRKVSASKSKSFSSQENGGYESDESKEDWKSKAVGDDLETDINDLIRNATNCVDDNQLNSINELLFANPGIKKILQSREKSLVFFDFINGSSKFISHEIVNQCIKANIIGTESSEVTEKRKILLEKLECHSEDTELPLNLAEKTSSFKAADGSGTVVKYPENVEVITINKSHDPLGLTVFNDGNSVKIGRIIYGGAAAKSGLFQEGSEIMAVNGIDIRTKLVGDVYKMLAGMTGEISFVVVPPPGSSPTAAPLSPCQMVHFKARFNYDPEDDARLKILPCRDLGIGFQRGDILHVTDQRDPKWWQAYRDDEYDQPLAGLIPSMQFQIRRESLLRALAKDNELNKNGRTLKKNPQVPSFQSDTSEEPLMPYEAVDLYWPRQSFKRPVVIMGVDDIGRTEICQKFNDFSDRFTVPIPHTSRPKTYREEEGEEFHFISRFQFEAGISIGKFIDYQKLDKNYIGITYEAVWETMRSGKTCILNLNPLSMRTFRNCGLMPYIVLIAPPCLERLKLRKAELGEYFEEEELKKIILDSRDIEIKFDNYIDHVLVNQRDEETFQQIIRQINSIERDPHWVPATWLNSSR